jgi:cell division protein FtsL
MAGRSDRKEGPRHSPLIAVLLIVALAVTLAGVFPFRQILAQNRQVENSQNKLTALQQENAVLQQQIDDLMTDAGVEQLAREQLGMVEPGEIGVTIESPPGSELPAPADPAESFDDRGFMQKLWDFLTGRDLEPDE